jgi:[ribosomal protein S5]-alanine N-acetyltransferase
LGERVLEINTERLLIVSCTLENYSKLSNQYKMGPHIEMYLEQLKRDSSVKGWGVWFVILRENHQVIGDIGFKGKPNEQKTVEIGYGIIPAAQNKGFATEAVQGLIDWAFSSGQVEKVIAECLEDNIASIRVLEKIGMERTFAKDEMLYWELENPFK